MKVKGQSGIGTEEVGSALLIAIFALLLISVVGLALVVSTGTDSALAGNYRNSTAAYYAAVAGLEEARGRLLWKNPDYLNKTNTYSTLFSTQGKAALGVSDVIYIINAASGETVDPTDSASPYADNDYQGEMGWPLSSANVHAPSPSVSPMAGLPGPLYKWVRINVVTEKAFGADVNGDGSIDSFTPLYYNGSGLNLNSAGNEALEITSFVLPNTTGVCSASDRDHQLRRPGSGSRRNEFASQQLHRVSPSAASEHRTGNVVSKSPETESGGSVYPDDRAEFRRADQQGAGDSDGIGSAERHVANESNDRGSQWRFGFERVAQHGLWNPTGDRNAQL